MSEVAEFKSRFQRLLELRMERDIDKTKAKRSEAAYREAEAELYDALQDAGIRGRISFDFGSDLGRASFQLRSTKYGRVIDADVATAALEAEGLGEVIFERRVREKRLHELVRDKLESRSELPDGIDYYERRGVSISRK